MKNVQFIRKVILPVAIGLVSYQSIAQEQTPYSLEDLWQMTIENNTALQLSAGQIDVAAAKVQQVKDKGLPQIGVNAQLTRLYTLSDFLLSDSDGNVVFGLPKDHFDAQPIVASASKELFTGFGHQAEHEIADYMLEASRYDHMQVQSDLKLGVASLYLNIIKMVQSSATVKANLDLITQKETEVKNFLDNDLVTETDLLDVQLQRSDLEIVLLDLQNKEQIARYKLGQLVGYAGDGLIKVDTTFHRASVSDQTNLEEGFSKEERADLLAAEHKIKAAESGIKRLKSANYPHVEVAATYIYLNPDVSKGIIPESNHYLSALNLGLSVKYSIGALYNMKGRKDEASVKLHQANLQYDYLSQQMESEIFEEQKNLQSSIEKERVARSAMHNAQRNFDLSNSKFRNGLILGSDLVKSQNMLLKSQMDLIAAQIDIQMVYYRLQKAKGILN